MVKKLHPVNWSTSGVGKSLSASDKCWNLSTQLTPWSRFRLAGCAQTVRKQKTKYPLSCISRLTGVICKCFRRPGNGPGNGNCTCLMLPWSEHRTFYLWNLCLWVQIHLQVHGFKPPAKTIIIYVYIYIYGTQKIDGSNLFNAKISVANIP